MPDRPTFTLSGLNLPRQEDPLGLWELAAPASTSFVSASTAAQVPTWRVVLPPEPETERAALSDQHQALTDVNRALIRTQKELSEFGAGGQPSFAVDEPLAAPKAALWKEVAVLRAPQSYGLFDGQGSAERQTLHRRWTDFIAQLRQLLTTYAQIETACGAEEIGCTRVGWSGDFSTTWLAGATAQTQQQHLSTVKLALASRLALLRLVMVVASGAASLAATASVPGGQLLLIPATWRFVREALQELGSLQRA